MNILNKIITFAFITMVLLLGVMSNNPNPTISELETIQLMKMISILLCVYAGFLLILGDN
jgi:hypothetical protein